MILNTMMFTINCNDHFVLQSKQRIHKRLNFEFQLVHQVNVCGATTIRIKKKEKIKNSI